MGLTDKQAAFVDAFCGEAKWVASKAARIAGYAHPGQQGWVLLRHPLIKPLIDARFEAEREESERRMREAMAATLQAQRKPKPVSARQRAKSPWL